MAGYGQPKSCIHLTSSTQLAEAMVRMEQAGEGYRLPLVRAAADGSLNLLVVTHGSPVPAVYLKQDKPTAIILADDHPNAGGPGTWMQVRRLLRWAHVVVLHATGGQPEHYELISCTTVMVRRVLVVEMQQRHHEAWLALVRQYMPRVRLLSIMPPPGDQHPRLPTGEVVH